jgi:hypothetical protein
LFTSASRSTETPRSSASTDEVDGLQTGIGGDHAMVVYHLARKWTLSQINQGSGGETQIGPRFHAATTSPTRASAACSANQSAIFRFWGSIGFACGALQSLTVPYHNFPALIRNQTFLSECV